MNTSAVPSFGTVLRQQLRLLWLSRRPQLLAVLMIGALLMMRVIVWWTNTQVGMSIDVLFGQVTSLIMIIGGLWAGVVWRDDPPKHRRYHWSLPVDVTQHDLARVLAGAVWLFAATAAYYVAGSLLALIDGGAASLREVAGPLALYYALAPLLAYLLLSGIGIASNRPFEWVLGLFFGIQALAALTMLLDRDHLLTRAFREVLAGPWGLGVALSGAVPSQQPGTSPGMFGGWLPVVLLWIIIASAILPIIALRRRGRA